MSTYCKNVVSECNVMKTQLPTLYTLYKYILNRRKNKQENSNEIMEIIQHKKSNFT